MRIETFVGAGLALILLAGCEPPIPESGPQGAAFETPAQYAARREAQLTGRPQPLQPEATIRPPAPADASEAAEIANATRAVLRPQAEAATAPTRVASAPQAAPAPTSATPPGTSAPLDLDRNNPEISREQDFEAVSAARSIEADAARVNAARQQYQLVRPTELQRPDEDAPNIVA